MGGIAVNEHFEINVVPLAVRITHYFYNTLMKYFFPDKTEADSAHEEPASPALAALKGIFPHTYISCTCCYGVLVVDTGLLESRARSPAEVR